VLLLGYYLHIIGVVEAGFDRPVEPSFANFWLRRREMSVLWCFRIRWIHQIRAYTFRCRAPHMHREETCYVCKGRDSRRKVYLVSTSCDVENRRLLLFIFSNRWKGNPSYRLQNFIGSQRRQVFVLIYCVKAPARSENVRPIFEPGHFFNSRMLVHTFEICNISKVQTRTSNTHDKQREITTASYVA
jgi:hypothetical protein